MAQQLDRVSLSVELRGDYFEFDSRYLLGVQPFNEPQLRYYIHECVHLWQLLGSGYLSNLSRSRWKALKRWEATGELPKPSDHFTRVDSATGFSAWQLSEALCRFWDVHISGPPDLLGQRYAGEEVHDSNFPPDWLTRGLTPEVIESIRAQRSYSGAQYDEWMLREDSYAEPYRKLRQRGGSRWAAALFPIVGYFALQTPKPATAFTGSLDLLADYRLPEDCKYIHDTWRAIFPDVANACGQAAFTYTSTMLTPGANVIAAMAQEGHLVYRHYLSLLAMANEMWATDARLALPGDPEFRLQLSVFFLPPLVKFHNGRWATDTVAAKVGLLANVPDLIRQPKLAEESQAIDTRLKAMGVAALLTHPGSAEPTPDVTVAPDSHGGAA